jgi:surface antigen
MRMHILPFVVAMLLILSAAVPAHAGDDTILGTGIGAAVGGLFGSQLGHGSGQIVSTGLGVAVGGLIGNEVGQSIENENSSVTYASGSSGYYSSAPAPIVYQSYSPNYVAPPAPPPTYIDQQAGTYCRQFSQQINIGGRLRESYGVACLQPDGSWRIVQ